jgi:hypothetical protein
LPVFGRETPCFRCQLSVDGVLEPERRGTNRARRDGKEALGHFEQQLGDRFLLAAGGLKGRDKSCVRSDVVAEEWAFDLSLADA